MSRVESVSNDRHTFCHKRAAFSVSEKNGLCCLPKSTKGYFHAVDILPQLFLHPDSIQVFVSCAGKSGRITSNRNRQKNLGSCCKNVQHSKMIFEQLWLNFDNHIQLSRTLLTYYPTTFSSSRFDPSFCFLCRKIRANYVKQK